MFRQVNGESADKAVDQWEYLLVDLYANSSWLDSKGAQGDPLGGSYIESQAAVMDQFGADGWELVGVTNWASGGNFRLFFKRSRQ